MLVQKVNYPYYFTLEFVCLFTRICLAGVIIYFKISLFIQSTVVTSKFKFCFVESARYRKEEADRNGTILSEDYAEIIDEEGDYSTPASEYS